MLSGAHCIQTNTVNAITYLVELTVYKLIQ